MGVLGLKRRMQKARVEVDVVSCNTLLNALAICGKWDEALSFLQARPPVSQSVSQEGRKECLKRRHGHAYPHSQLPRA
jgi:pentatricopeptide repeat protein